LADRITAAAVPRFMVSLDDVADADLPCASLSLTMPASRTGLDRGRLRHFLNARARNLLLAARCQSRAQ